MRNGSFNTESPYFLVFCFLCKFKLNALVVVAIGHVFDVLLPNVMQSLLLVLVLVLILVLVFSSALTVFCYCQFCYFLIAFQSLFSHSVGRLVGRSIG